MKPERISSYRLAKELGKGSMGVVYEGLPDGEGQAVAIKLFFPDTHLSKAETDVLLERFEREGQSLSSLHHDNVVEVLEVGSQDGIEYIVMEKLEGHNIKELLALGTRFTLAETFELVLQLLAGLSACHRGGIIHRDIKPANVVRSEQGLIKLTDFGIARIITDQTLSRGGTVVGTPNYMSPEQIKGEEVDPRSDLFSTGVLMYELITGKKPFEGPDVTSIMYNVTSVHPAPPSFYNGALPPEIEEICFKAMAKDRAKRYATADEFAQAIRVLERDLHYRDDTEAILNALPAAPAQDAGAVAPDNGFKPFTQSPVSTAGSLPAHKHNAVTGSISLAGGGSIVTGTVYCVDCGMSNREDQEFCSRCMRPLLKRADISKLAGQQVKSLQRAYRSDQVFMTCLSIVIAAVVIMILYLFFRNV